MKVQVQLLNKSHVRTGFECGKALLDNYIITQASQDVKRERTFINGMQVSNPTTVFI